VMEWWLWILFAAVGVIVLYNLIRLVGNMLPPSYTIANVKDSYDFDSETVWEALQDYNSLPLSGKAATRIRALDPNSDGPPGWEETLGNEDKISVLTESEVPRRRIVRVLSSEVVPMKSRWIIDLDEMKSSNPREARTLVSITQHVTISDGTWHVPLFRIMIRIVGKMGMTNFLTQLKKNLTKHR